MYHLSNCMLKSPGVVNATCDCPTNLQFVVRQQRLFPSIWLVEAVDHEGESEIYVAVFHGPDAKGRAEEYADFKQSQQDEEDCPDNCDWDLGLGETDGSNSAQ